MAIFLVFYEVLIPEPISKLLKIHAKKKKKKKKKIPPSLLSKEMQGQNHYHSNSHASSKPIFIK